MKIQSGLTDHAVLIELGRRLAAARISKNQTQAELAGEAGISKRTLEHLESGDTVQSTSLVRVLRQLEKFDVLESLLPEEGPGPMDLLRLKGKTRRRAYAPRSSRAREVKVDKEPVKPAKNWSWGDRQ